MPKSVVVVAGVADSGKSGTLHKIADGHKLEDTHVYSISGRRTCVYFSSPQELTREFCKYKLVIGRVKHMIDVCESQGCDLLIIAFTMYAVNGKLNTACITKPLAYLRRKIKNVRLIYIRKGIRKGARKNTAKKIGLADRLMFRLKAKTIKSDENYGRQARRVLDVIRSVP